MKFTYVTALIVYALLYLSLAIFLGLKGLSYAIEDVGILKLEVLSDADKKLAAHKIATMIAFGAFLGFIKGKFVLSKVVHRVVCQMTEKEEPLRLADLFNRRTFLLMGGMMVLGQILRFSPLSFTMKAMIDFAVAAALIYAALLFAKRAYLFHKELPN